MNDKLQRQETEEELMERFDKEMRTALLGEAKDVYKRQEFVSNVSHELKTPMTSMKVLADSLLEQENLPVEMYQEFMGDIATVSYTHLFLITPRT